MRFRKSNNIKILKRECKLLVRNIYESAFYRLDRCKRWVEPPRKVVFVCMGNICRSAFAEYLMRSVAKDKSLSIESCGLNVGVRTHSPNEAIIAAKSFGLNLDGHLSKGLDCCDMEHADLILAMEYWHFRRLTEILPHKKENIRLLREFTPFPENIFCNINDPFGQSVEVFEKCFSQIERSIAFINSEVGS